jgi:hypothetical protein
VRTLDFTNSESPFSVEEARELAGTLTNDDHARVVAILERHATMDYPANKGFYQYSDAFGFHFDSNETNSAMLILFSSLPTAESNNSGPHSRSASARMCRRTVGAHPTVAATTETSKRTRSVSHLSQATFGAACTFGVSSLKGRCAREPEKFVRHMHRHNIHSYSDTGNRRAHSITQPSSRF